jgi:hypothetical protein
MADINPDLRPILEMFAMQLKHPNVGSVLGDWRNMLERGMHHFGRKEALNDDLDFNTLIYTTLNPAPAKTGRRITLEPKLDLIGVVTSKSNAHEQFRYLKNEIVIVQAVGRWDYARNVGPLELSIASDVTVRLPGGQPSQAASERLIKEVGRLCFSWVVVNKMTTPDQSDG